MTSKEMLLAEWISTRDINVLKVLADDHEESGNLETAEALRVFVNFVEASSRLPRALSQIANWVGAVGDRQGRDPLLNFAKVFQDCLMMLTPTSRQWRVPEYGWRADT